MSNLVTLYVTEFPKALRSLYPTSVLPESAITIGYQRATAKNTKFIVWGFQRVAQQVFSGGTEARGVDQPIFNLNFHAEKMVDAAALVDTMVNAWNSYTGLLTPALSVAKITVEVQSSAYDEENSFHIIEVDVQMTVNVMV